MAWMPQSSTALLPAEREAARSAGTGGTTQCGGWTTLEQADAGCVGGVATRGPSTERALTGSQLDADATKNVGLGRADW